MTHNIIRLIFIFFNVFLIFINETVIIFLLLLKKIVFINKFKNSKYNQQKYKYLLANY